MELEYYTILFNAIIYLVIFLIVCVFFTICIYLRLKRKLDLPQLNYSLIFGIIGFWFLFEYYMGYLFTQNAEIFVLIGLMALNWCNYCLYLHYEAIIALVPQSGIRHQIVFSLAIGASIIDFFKIIGFLNPYPIIDFFFLSTLLGLFAFTISLLNVQKSHKALKARGTRWDLISLSFMIGAPLTYIFSGVLAMLNNQDIIVNNLGVLAGSLLLTGLILILLNYVINNHLYRLPYPVLFVSLYSETGLLLYSSQFDRSSEHSVNFHEDLISKLFSTVDTLVKGVIHSGSKLKLIETFNYKMIFSQTAQKLTFCVVTHSASYFLKKSIERFLEKLPPHISTYSAKPLKQELDELMQKSFTGSINTIGGNFRG